MACAMACIGRRARPPAAVLWAEKLQNACGGVRGGDKRSIPALCARQQSSRRRARAGRAAG